MLVARASERVTSEGLEGFYGLSVLASGADIRRLIADGVLERERCGRSIRCIPRGTRNIGRRSNGLGKDLPAAGHRQSGDQAFTVDAR